MQSIVVTGVSSGIGRAAAAAFVERGYRVFGSVRREEDGARLRAEFGEQFIPLVFDVTDHEAIAGGVARVEQILAEEEPGQSGLAGLINNAGISVSGPAMHLPVDAYRRQFEVNLFGLIAVTQAFLPLLGARRDCPFPPGRIVNISSVSGRIAFPFLSPYAASKHAVEAYSDSLRRELMLYGVDVIVVQPGAVQSAIWDKAQADDPAMFGETDYYPQLVHLQRIAGKTGRNAMPTEQVTNILVKAIESRTPKARYPLPGNRIMGWWLPRFAPTRWFDRQVAKRLNLMRET